MVTPLGVDLLRKMSDNKYMPKMAVILCLHSRNEMNSKLVDYSSLKEKEKMETNFVISS